MAHMTPRFRSFLARSSAAALVSLAMTVGAHAEPPPPPGAEIAPSDIMPKAFALPDDAPKPRRPELAPPPDARADAGKGSKDKAEQPLPSTAEQRQALLKDLYAKLSAAPDAETAAPITAAIEKLWAFSGSPTADLLADRALFEAQRNNPALAFELLTAAIELQPDYAEAWNRRAFLYYMRDEIDLALGDLRRVLALEPNHYKALEGLAAILQNGGEKQSALKAYESLIKVYPAMPGAKSSRDALLEKVQGQGI